MPDYWITSHWPTPEPETSSFRNVYFKTGKRKNLPKIGDVVFIYESAVAAVDGKKVEQVVRCYLGKREMKVVPAGRSAIIGKVVVSAAPRAIQATDVVYDFGNVEEWSVIPCDGRTAVPEIAKSDLMEILGHPRNTPPRFLSLWRIPDAQAVQRLIKQIEKNE